MIDNFSDFFQLLDYHISLKGNKTAIYYADEQISYSQLGKNINRFSNILKKYGINPGERVIIALPDCPDWFYSFLGSLKYGAVPIPLNPDMKQESYEYILKDSETIALVTLKSSSARIANSDSLKYRLYIDDEHYKILLSEMSDDFELFKRTEDDIAFMLYTSGSTGISKGVPHRYGDIFCVASSYGKHVLNMSENDICFSASKLFFAYGFGNSFILPLSFGASTVLFPDRVSPEEAFGIINEYNPTVFFAVPTLYNMMLKFCDDKISFPSIRQCISAGEALPAGIYHEWKHMTGLDLIDGFGSSETLYIVISNRPGEIMPGSSGFVVPSYEAKIVDAMGEAVPSGQPGYILIRGRSTSPFYWNKPEKTAEMMLPDGWLKTGDMYIEENGCFTYQGRGDDMFKVGGNWVSPIQIESVLREHPSVMECGVASRKLENLVKPVAFVVLNPGFHGDFTLTKDIRNYILDRLPEYMCPVDINFVDELPKTETGKIQRFKMRNA